MLATTAPARKRAVKLKLNESLVAEARNYTSNLSATMENLLAAYVMEQQQARRRQMADTCANDWNGVHDMLGSFADAHFTL